MNWDEFWTMLKWELRETEGYVNIEDSFGSIQHTFSLLLCFMCKILCCCMANFF